MPETKIVKINERNLNNPVELKKLQFAADYIKNGKIVVFPTETVYGLGANAFDASAVKKIYEVKGRPPDNPLIVHFNNAEDIYKYAEVPDIADKIIKNFMPAPLTLVLKKKSGEVDCFESFTGKIDTVAVRVPKSETARKLIELAETPIAAPSANLSGKPSPTKAEHIIKDLDGKADMIICGENCEIGLESTVISFNCDNGDNSVNILRSGFITRDMLSEYVIRKTTKYSDFIDFTAESVPPQSPGMKYKHYSPDAPLYILNGEDKKIIDFVTKKVNEKSQKIGILCYNEMTESFRLNNFNNTDNINIISLGKKNDLSVQGRNLFDALNKFNELDVDIIYAVEPPETGIGEAIRNRLFKAAGGKIISL